VKPHYASKVVWLAFIPLGGAVLFSLVRIIENTALQAILTCVGVGLMLVAIALIVRSQLGTMAQEEPAMPDADRDVLDSLEPLREGDGDRRYDANDR
jgi:hypothetical protein